MGVARARRIAERVHRGQLTREGGLFLDELDQVVRLVEENGGGALAVQAAWLHAVPETSADLASEDVPLHVRQVVQALRCAPGWSQPQSSKVARAEGIVRAAKLAQSRSTRPPAEDAEPATLAELLVRHRAKTDVRSEIYGLVAAPLDADDPAVAELVEQWSKSGDEWEAMIAMKAAHSAGMVDTESLLREVTDGSPSEASTAIRTMTGSGEAEITALRAALLRPGVEYRWVRREARVRLRKIGGPAAAAAADAWFVDPMDTPWQYDRRWLSRNAGRVVPLLIEVLGDPAWQYEAPQALGSLRVEEAVGPLCDQARTAKNPIPYVLALGSIGSQTAGRALAELTGHAEARVREAAVQALGRTGGADVTAVALAACDDPDVHVRYRAAKVLAEHGDERAVITLIRLCDTDHAAEAADALARIGDPRAAPTLWYLFNNHPDRAARHAAGRGLARIECEDHWPSPEPVVERAYMWLHGHKPEWSRFSLEGGTTHSDAMVRVRAIEAFGRLRDPAGIPHIRPRLTDPDARVRAAARNVLKLLGDDA
ncbi:HEAT repeat domain-containing protein [Lentzea sp. NPDC058450]|uniref:HEAT repeat domain-containing protein n=1 Tax=Lentzea sp. NPDC058450 TaxID=3346505 RepID=UPI00364D4A86